MVTLVLQVHVSVIYCILACTISISLKMLTAVLYSLTWNHKISAVSGSLLLVSFKILLTVILFLLSVSHFLQNTSGSVISVLLNHKPLRNPHYPAHTKTEQIYPCLIFAVTPLSAEFRNMFPLRSTTHIPTGYWSLWSYLQVNYCIKPGEAKAHRKWM